MIRGYRSTLLIASALIVGMSPVWAADITGLDLVLDKDRLLAKIAVSASVGYRVALSADGLVATIQLNDVKVPSRAPDAHWPDPVVAALIQPAGTGARITVIARRPLRFAPEPATAGANSIVIPFLIDSEKPVAAAPPPRPLPPEPKLAPEPKPVPKATRSTIALPPLPEAPKWTLVLDLPLPSPIPPATKAPPHPPQPPAPPPRITAKTLPLLELPPAPQWSLTLDLPQPRDWRTSKKKQPEKLRPPTGMTPDDPLMIAGLKGDAAAELELGTRCLSPDAPDVVGAKQWFLRAAAHGSEIAAYNLGRFAQRGLAGPPDEAEAARYFTESADRGYPDAQYALALMLLEGRGVPQDVGRAQELLQKAGLKGHAGARRLLDEIKSQAISAPTPLRK